MVNSVFGAMFGTFSRMNVLSPAELISLCKEEDESKLKRILLGKPDYHINCVDSEGHSPLILACKKGWIDVVALFVVADGITETINYQDREGKSALAWACALGHEKVVASLLTVKELDINHPGTTGLSPLVISILSGLEGIAKLLINDQRTILNQVTPKNVKIVEANLDGVTPLILAVRQNRIQIAEFLIDDPRTFVDLASDQNISAFTAACILNRVEIAAKLLTKEEVNVNRTCKEFTPLMLACKEGYLGIVKLLLNDPQKRVDINRAGPEKFNALMMAVMSKDLECVRLLVSVPEIEVNHAANYGFTALAAAQLSGLKDITKLLLDAGAKDSTTYLGWGVSWATYLLGRAGLKEYLGFKI